MFLHLSPHASCNKALHELVKTREKRKRGKYHRRVVKQQQCPVGKNASIIQYDIQMSIKQSFVLLNMFLKQIEVKWPPQPPSPSYGGTVRGRENLIWLLENTVDLLPHFASQKHEWPLQIFISTQRLMEQKIWVSNPK